MGNAGHCTWAWPPRASALLGYPFTAWVEFKLERVITIKKAALTAVACQKNFVLDVRPFDYTAILAAGLVVDIGIGLQPLSVFKSCLASLRNKSKLDKPGVSSISSYAASKTLPCIIPRLMKSTFDAASLLRR